MYNIFFRVVVIVLILLLLMPSLKTKAKRKSIVNAVMILVPAALIIYWIITYFLHFGKPGLLD